jgi:hypothetical protein
MGISKQGTLSKCHMQSSYKSTHMRYPIQSHIHIDTFSKKSILKHDIHHHDAIHASLFVRLHRHTYMW